jgi:mono/diheme cytochrome c family protein
MLMAWKADAMVRAMTRLPAVSAFRARPMSALAVLFVTAALANAVLVGCGGNKSTTDTTSNNTTTPPPDQTAQPPAGTGTAPAGDLGAQVYSQRCALCHGAGGHGDGPAAASLNPKPRNHTDGSYMNARTDAELLEVIHNGKGAMPAWKGVLSEEEITAVLKHVRSLAVPPYPGS